MRWCRRRPPAVQLRMATVDCTRASSTSGNSPRGAPSVGRCTGTCQAPSVMGALTGHPHVAAEAHRHGPGPADHEPVRHQVGGEALADPAQVETDPGRQAHGAGLGIEGHRAEADHGRARPEPHPGRQGGRRRCGRSRGSPARRGWSGRSGRACPARPRRRPRWPPTGWVTPGTSSRRGGGARSARCRCGSATSWPPGARSRPRPTPPARHCDPPARRTRPRRPWSPWPATPGGPNGGRRVVGHGHLLPVQGGTVGGGGSGVVGGWVASA